MAQLDLLFYLQTYLYKKMTKTVNILATTYIMYIAWEGFFNSFKPGNSQKKTVHTQLYENLFKYIENFTTKKWKCSDKNSDILFYISAQNRLWTLIRTASVRQS